MKQQILQIAMGALGSFGFSIIFNIRGKKIILAILGGALSYTAYLIAYHFYQDPVPSILLATIIADVFAEICARLFKAPVIILLVPMLIPLIPGGDLYYAMQHFVFSEMEEFSMTTKLVVEEMGAIAGGIIVVAFLAQFFTKLANLRTR
jgi:uncharacterized membrane protein YjjB (DUF3815 family)